jgi:hypothetical protein
VAGPRSARAADKPEDAATAEVELDYPSVRFVDYLTLLLVDGDWLIVNKAFKAFPKEARTNTRARHAAF